MIVEIQFLVVGLFYTYLEFLSGLGVSMKDNSTTN